MLRKRTFLLAVLFLLGLGLGLAWFHPTAAYYRTLIWARVYYAFRRPQAQVFRPGEKAYTATVPPTSAGYTRVAPRSPTPSGSAGATSVPAPTAARPTTTPTPVWTPPSLPSRVNLALQHHEYQLWNNCGPATLSMALAYWGWEGGQKVVAQGTKPNPRDKNVTPADMERFVEHRLHYGLAWRAGGRLDLLKTFLAARYPVLIEQGFYAPDVEGWMGHYRLLFGYDDEERVFLAHDSYLGPNQSIPYDEIEARWADFNRIFLVVYPPYHETSVRDLLGPWNNAAWAWEQALTQARHDALIRQGADRFFALFNQGEALTHLGRYAEAAAAFDRAFDFYAILPEEERPWRLLWYRDAPYLAYYGVGRYRDVIALADFTLGAMSEPVLEEAYYWRGMARAALGETEAARADLQKALELNPLYQPARQALTHLNATP